jgi:hypothetical protein
MNSAPALSPAVPSFSDRACFIAGSAKSGTTLLMSLFDGHPELLAFPEETAYFPTVRRKYLHAGREVQARYLMETAESRLLFAAESQKGNRDYGNFPREEYRRDFEATARDAANAEKDLLAIMVESYARVRGIPIETITRWIEKTPANRYCLPDIRSRFPGAKVILTLRDPRAVLAAYLLRKRRKGMQFSVYDCVSHWRQSAEVALSAPQNTSWLKVVKFEDLVRRPAEIMPAVCDFLGVKFVPSVLMPTKAGEHWRGNSAVKEKFTAVDAAPAERWKTSLTPEEIGWVELHCREWMSALGYEPVGKPSDLRHWARKFPEESWNDFFKGRRHSLRDRLAGRWKAPLTASARQEAAAPPSHNKVP